MLTSKKDETEQRINALLQTLSGITFVPENWNEAAFWTTIAEAGFTQQDITSSAETEFFQQFIDMQWPWEKIESFADILAALALHHPHLILKERVKHLYEFIQKESKVFSFEIMNKINKL